MPRSARAIKLETRSARAKLPARRAPYFLKVAKGLRLGYYRGSGAGTWIGRRYLGSGQYETASIGVADDTTEADNVQIFDFWRRRKFCVAGLNGVVSPTVVSCARVPTPLRWQWRITSLRSQSKNDHRH